ncbi:MAG: DUF4031 domain-containing protein [Micavibrio sp.]|nr:DUF4031 domain-containing protein [Micavibrio sp.]
MIYTDKIHLVSDTSIKELKDFAKSVGLNKCYFEGVKKGHPHFDLINKNKNPLFDKNGIKFIDKVIQFGAKVVHKKEITEINHRRKWNNQPCKKHKRMADKLSYIGWHDWADRKTNMGHIQKKCVICDRYLFKCEI